MARSSPSRRQTRLAFTPLPSSSPVSKDYNQQIRDRAAAVTLEGSPNPAKRRKLRNSSKHVSSHTSSSNEPGVLMPTPDASLRHGGDQNDDATDSDPVHPSQRRTRLQMRSGPASRQAQQQIDFSRSREQSSFDTPIRLSSSSNARSSKTGMFNKSGQSRIVEDLGEESESDAELPSPGKLTSMRVMSKKPTSASSARDSDDEDDAIVVKKQPLAPKEKVVSSDDEDDDMPTTHGKRKRARKHASSDDFIDSSPPHAIESDDDVVIVGQSRRRGGRGQESENDVEQAEDAEPVTPRRRKLKRGRPMSQQEKADLDEDLDFLGPSSDVDTSSRTPRNTQSQQKNARRKALEALKRKRNGDLQSVSEEPEQLDDDDEEDVGGDDSEDDRNDEDDDLQVMSSRQMFQEDDEDANFLTDDGEDAPLGVPEGMPIEFTQYASMKPKGLFKYAVEWMVQKKINPAYEGTDELYRLSFKKLDDEVRGLAGSKFTSSAWTPQFTMALEARPDIAYEAIDRTSAEHFMRDKCDACNRSSHPATYEIQFQGNPYFHETLEEVANDDDESSGSELSAASRNAAKDERPAYDETGREIPPANTKFYVGKFCMANAHTAHSLRHWRYHLNEWVITWLIKEGYCAPDKIVERDSWNTRKRRKYANKIVDRMANEGTIKELWRSFRDNTNDARNSKQGRYGGMSP